MALSVKHVEAKRRRLEASENRLQVVLSSSKESNKTDHDHETTLKVGLLKTRQRVKVHLSRKREEEEASIYAAIDTPRRGITGNPDELKRKCEERLAVDAARIRAEEEMKAADADRRQQANGLAAKEGTRVAAGRVSEKSAARKQREAKEVEDLIYRMDSAKGALRAARLLAPEFEQKTTFKKLVRPHMKARLDALLT